MSQQSAATIEDYKKYVKELKLRIRQLVDKNKNLTDQLRGHDANNGQKMRQNILNQSIKLNRKAIVIQKYVRRFLARKKFAKNADGRGFIARVPANRENNLDNESLLLSILKGCERMGMNLEMLFRAADSKSTGEVSVETFRTFLQRFKLNLSRQDISKLLYLVDEDGTGLITREEFCSTLSAFGVASESNTSEIAKPFLFQTLQNFHDLLTRTGTAIDSYFNLAQISYADFLNFLSTALETNDNILKEKERHMLLNHFDRSKRGYIDRRFLISEVNKIPQTLDARSFYNEEAIERTEAMSHGKGSMNANKQPTVMRSPMLAKTAGIETGEGPLLRNFVQAFEKNKQSVQVFFDIFATHINAHRNQVQGNFISVPHFHYFLALNFSSLFSDDFVESFCNLLQEKSNGKKTFKLKPSTMRPSSTNKQMPQNSRTTETSRFGSPNPADHMTNNFTQDDSTLPMHINIIEFKSKLLNYCNIKPDTSKLLKVLLALKLEQQGLSTVDYFKSIGVNPKQRIDFSQFFIFGQKALEANFQEITAIFNKLEPKNETVSPLPLIAEIDAFRSSHDTSAILSHKKQTRDSQEDLDAIKKKLAIQSLNSIDAIISKIKNGCMDIMKETEHFGESGKGFEHPNSIVTHEDMQRLIENIDKDSGPNIALHELLDFVLQNFASRDDVLGIYLKVIAGYLDKNEPKTKTDEYFRRFKMHPQGFYDKLLFVKKIRQIFGLTTEHSQMFMEAFVDEDTDSVGVQDLINAINKHRKLGVCLANKHAINPQATDFKEKASPSLSNKENKDRIEREKPKVTHQPTKPADSVPKPGKTEPNNKQTHRQEENQKAPKESVQEQTKIGKQSTNQQQSTATHAPEQISARHQTSQPKSSNHLEEEPQSNVTTLTGKEIIELKNDSFGFNNLDRNELTERLLDVVKGKFYEVKHLDQVIQMSDQTDLNLVNLRRIIRPMFTPAEEKLFINFFMKCDQQNNGLLAKPEWENFATRASLRDDKIQKSQKPQASLDWTVNTEEEFFDRISKISDDERIDLDLLNEFIALRDKPLSILFVKRTIQLYYGKEQTKVNTALKMLRFLDLDNNSSFSFGEIRFIILFMNLISFTTSDKVIDGKLLRSLGIDAELIKSYGMAFIRQSQSQKGYSAKVESMVFNPDKINVFNFAKNAIMHFGKDSEAAILINFICQIFKKHGSFEIEYETLLKEISVLDFIKKFDNKIRIHPSSKDLYREIHALRRQLNLQNNSVAGKKVNFGALTANLRSVLQADKLTLAEKDQFELYVFFVEIEQIEAKRSQTDIKQSQQLSRSQKIPNLLEIILKKMYAVSFSEEAFDQCLCELTANSSVDSLSFLEFQRLLNSTQLSLKDEQIYSLFLYLDEKKTNKVKLDAVREFFATSFRDIQSVKTNAIKASVLTRAESGVKEPTAPTLQSSEIDILNHLKKIELKPENFFMEKKTIVNDVVSALKVGIELSAALTKPQNVKQSAQGKTGGGKFEDPEFGPRADDPFGKSAIYFDEVEPGMVDPEEIVWLRPEQISQTQEPKFLDSGASCNDVIQGAIGDCWFISALSILATNDNYISENIDTKSLAKGKIDDAVAQKLVSGLYPTIFHFLQKFGIYVFKFFKDYAWRFVIIDDRLPCYSGNDQEPDLIFARCDSRNEFWVPLIEKAYAKMHGTYQALISGQIDDGLVDMTGCVSDKLKLKLPNGAFDSKVLISPETLWDRLNKDIVNGSMMGCSIVGEGIEGKVRINGEFIGLISGHAYSILDLVDIGNYKLVRIRNPWGSAEPTEWNGAWSDNSKELISNLDKINKKAVERWKHEAEKVEAESKDGCFFMEYQEFLNIWHNIAIAKNFANEFSGLRFAGQWSESNSGGTPYTNKEELFKMYLTNPQFILDYKPKDGKSEVELFLSLGQEDGRVKSRGGEPFPFTSYIYPISLSVFSLQPNESKLPVFEAGRMKNSPVIKNYRDIQLSMRLKPGKYAIIPSTKQAGSFGKFFLSVYFSCPKSEIKIEDAMKQLKAEPIVEEEEAVQEFDEKLKSLLKNILLNVQ